MPELSQATKQLILRYREWHESLQPQQEASTVHVDEVASRVAAFYEKLRGIIDWKEEHLLKRGAIERMLKRRLLPRMELGNGALFKKEFAHSLVLELIRGGHFPNDRIKESKIDEVQRAINKYIYILNYGAVPQKKSKLQLYGWLSSIAACEIEEILTPSLKERALIDYMFELLKKRVRLNEGIVVRRGMGEEEKNIQIYISVQRALFKLDAPVISYHLLKYRYPFWKDLSGKKLKKITQNIYSIWEEIEKELNHPLGNRFYQVAEKYDTPYLLLGDIIANQPMEIEEKIAKPEALEDLINQVYNKRLKTLKSRLGRAAVYATLSIFFTNIISLLAIEIPFTKYFTGSFNFWAIGVDIFFPTLLMAFLVVTITPPKKGNREMVMLEVMKIAYQTENRETYEVRGLSKRGFILDGVISFFYFLSFCFFLGIVIWGLYQVKFPILSYFIFVIFLSLIAFAGAKIRQRSKELHIIEEKDTFFHFVADPFAVPIIQLGKWLTIRWKKYNIVAVFFNALIDMPFTVFVEFIEQWRYFLKEKKEEIH